jgi:asparagine synthase (glutamine-hydrolysing)
MLDAQGGGGRSMVAVSGDVAVGRRLTPLLPEDRFDCGPLTGADGTLLLVADVRLDNRDELAKELGLGREAAERSDSALLLMAWERWAAGALDRIVGAWAFALWDRLARRLLLARDPQGQRPLHYHVGPSFAAFASMPRGLHALGEVPRRIDRETLARFVGGVSPAVSRSFFDGVRLVPPGHMVTIERERVRTERFWTPSLEPIRLRSPDDYVDAVREQLGRAVRACLRGAGTRVGAHLSAGLDSGGVAATAAALSRAAGGTVIGFTAVPRAGLAEAAGPQALVDEGPLAAQTAALHFNIEPVLVRRTEMIVQGLRHGPELYDQPLPNPCNHGWATAVLDAARARSLSVLLTGQMGNLSFSHEGDELLSALLRSGRWLRLAREAMALRRADPGAGGLGRAALGGMLPGPLRLALRAVRRRSSEGLGSGLSHPDFQARSDEFSVERLPADMTQARLRTLEQFDFGAFNAGILAGWSVDLRDPTGDRRLIELCLRIPPDQYLSGGVRRSLARRVLADRLPPAVLAETRRGRQSADWPEMLDAARPEILAEVRLIEASAAAASVIDTARLRSLVEDWPARWGEPGQEARYRGTLLRALSAGNFARTVEAGDGLPAPDRSRPDANALLS